MRMPQESKWLKNLLRLAIFVTCRIDNNLLSYSRAASRYLHSLLGSIGRLYSEVGTPAEHRYQDIKRENEESEAYPDAMAFSRGPATISLFTKKESAGCIGLKRKA
jgi:hypothetical protein